jgi:hypothetical protein
MVAMGSNKTFQQKGDRGRMLGESAEFRRLRHAVETAAGDHERAIRNVCRLYGASSRSMPYRSTSRAWYEMKDDIHAGATNRRTWLNGKRKAMRVFGKLVLVQRQMPVTSRDIREVRNARSALHAVCRIRVGLL